MSWIRRAAWSFACLAIIAIVPAAGVHAQGANVSALNQQSVKLHSQGKDKEATAIAEKAVALAERTLGPDHPDTLKSLYNLASLYEEQGRHGEAEPLIKRALAGFERVYGNEAPMTLAAASSFGSLYESQGRHADAEPLFKRALEGFERLRGANDLQTLASADKLGSLYRVQGRYAEAEPLYKRALAGFERVLGPEHPDTLVSVSNMAQLYTAQGRYGEAEPLCKRALEARKHLLGAEHPKTLKSLIALADNYKAQGRYSEAEPLFRQALETSERVLGPDHPDTIDRMSSLASTIRAQGRFSEAQALFERALAQGERVLGPEHPVTIASANNLAAIYQAQGRYKEAEPLFKRALTYYERVLGPVHPTTMSSVGNLAALYAGLGRYGEAEPLYKRMLETRERLLGPEHPDTLTSVSGLAELYETLGRHAEAETLYKRAVEAREHVLGPEHPDTIASMNNLALLYKKEGRYAEAEPLYKRALAADEHVLGPQHPFTLDAVNNLAALYQATHRYEEAEQLYKRTLDAQDHALGPDHPQTLFTVGNLATLYSEQGHFDEAEPFQRRALEARERVLGPDHPETVKSVANLAALRFKQRDWAGAADLWRRSTAAIAARTLRNAGDVGQPVTGEAKGEAEQPGLQFAALVKSAYRLTPQGGMPDPDLSREMFQAAQWAQRSEAAKSLMQAARLASGDPVLAVLARERQDLVAEWQKRDRLRSTALSQAPEKNDAKAEAENITRLASIDARIKEIDKELAAKFPDYTELISPAAIAVEEVQAFLGDDEALVLFLDTGELGPVPEESFIWVVTKTASRWVRSAMGTPTLVQEVAALRCGLDEAAWHGPRCEQLTGRPYTDADRNAGKPLPFDYARAHRLYQALFGQVEDLIKGKHLLIVPSGPLRQLPFQVLVTAAPAATGEDKSPAWLIRDHPVSVLPAASSLKALRRLTRPGFAAKPMIGFGNPLLDGPDGTYADLARRARDNKTCAAIAPIQVASTAEAQGVAQTHTSGGLGDVSSLRGQVPLPNTASELCAIARDVDADAHEIYLGARATEHVVKRLSDTGELAKYRIVAFATHCAPAGDVAGNAEPGLIMTPPDIPSREDDGYLTASEIAALKLDADWVILSACNTAAGGALGAEALSELSRAFLYAQAQALLVSHWEVNSEATVKLITGALNRLAADKSIGSAEAMRQSMLDLIDHGKAEEEAHPANWAPFVVVGEGGTGR